MADFQVQCILLQMTECNHIAPCDQSRLLLLPSPPKSCFFHWLSFQTNQLTTVKQRPTTLSHHPMCPTFTKHGFLGNYVIQKLHLIAGKNPLRPLQNAARLTIVGNIAPAAIHTIWEANVFATLPCKYSTEIVKMSYMHYFRLGKQRKCFFIDNLDFRKKK